jgi:hypothetical protein
MVIRAGLRTSSSDASWIVDSTHPSSELSWLHGAFVLDESSFDGRNYFRFQVSCEKGSSSKKHSSGFRVYLEFHAYSEAENIIELLIQGRQSKPSKTVLCPVSL